jgi:hypothetical protein
MEDSPQSNTSPEATTQKTAQSVTSQDGKPLRPGTPQRTRGVEKDWEGAGWKHPYVLYLGATIVLVVFLFLMGYLAMENEWIPDRGIRR